MKRRYKKSNKKEIIENIIAGFIAYTIKAVVWCSAIILLFTALGAVVELCETNKVVCVCFFIVNGYYIVKQTIKEINL